MLAPTLALSIPMLTPKDHSHYQQSWSPCPHSSSDTSLSSGHCILNSAYWEAWVMKSIVNDNLREMYYHSHSISNMHCVFTNHPAYKEIIWKSCFCVLTMMINMKAHSSWTSYSQYSLENFLLSVCKNRPLNLWMLKKDFQNNCLSTVKQKIVLGHYL